MNTSIDLQYGFTKANSSGIQVVDKCLLFWLLNTMRLLIVCIEGGGKVIFVML